MQIKSLSPSSYNTYSECNWMWFLRYNLNFQDESGSAAMLGTIGHYFLEILSRASIVNHDPNSKIWDLEYLWNIVINYHFNKFPQICEQIKADKIKLACDGIRDLLNSEFSPISKNTISAELAFSLPIQDKEFIIGEGKDGSPEYFRVNGRIDRVDKILNHYYIYDYKFGRRDLFGSKLKEKKGVLYHHDIDIQAKSYHLAAMNLFPDAESITCIFYYVTDGKDIIVPFCSEDILDTKNMLLKRLRSIKANFDPQKTVSWKCKNFCYFGKTGICENVWQEKELTNIEFVQNKYQVLNDRRKH